MTNLQLSSVCIVPFFSHDATQDSRSLCYGIVGILYPSMLVTTVLLNNMQNKRKRVTIPISFEMPHTNISDMSEIKFLFQKLFLDSKQKSKKKNFAVNSGTYGR